LEKDSLRGVSGTFPRFSKEPRQLARNKKRVHNKRAQKTKCKMRKKISLMTILQAEKAWVQGSTEIYKKALKKTRKKGVTGPGVRGGSHPAVLHVNILKK